MDAVRVCEYNKVTDGPLNRASKDQLLILHKRYAWAAEFAVDKDVLEVACGAGVGIGSIAAVARHVVGGDIDVVNCEIARETYKDRPEVEILELDAEKMPFPSASFDLLLLFEALYYLNSPQKFFQEARRLLRPGGKLLISSVNCRWSGFNPSPFSTKYFDAAELAEALTRFGFAVRIYGGFPDREHKLIKTIRKAAVSLGMIPDTQRSKEWLKRIFYGELQPIPSELHLDEAPVEGLCELHSPYDSSLYRMIYWVASKAG